MFVELLRKNREWSERLRREQPDLLKELEAGQSPQFFWIGCSDSRVLLSRAVGAWPGEFFVHRNVANQVCVTDPNFMSCLQYAVDFLKVKHIIVCGHYRCGGIDAAMKGEGCGHVGEWLKNVHAVQEKYASELESLSGEAKFDRLCELNIAEQVDRLWHCDIVQNAWKRDQPLMLHGWIYNVTDGLIRDLEISCDGKSLELPK